MRNQDIFNENETTILNTLLRYKNKGDSTHSKDGWLRNYEIMKKGKDLETNSDKYYKTLTEKGIIERSKLQIFDDKNRESFPYFYRIKRDKITFKTLCIAFLSKKEYSFLESDYFEDNYSYAKELLSEFYKSISPLDKEMVYLRKIIDDLDDLTFFYSDYFIDFLRNPEQVKKKFLAINNILEKSKQDIYKKLEFDFKDELTTYEKEAFSGQKVEFILSSLIFSTLHNMQGNDIKPEIKDEITYSLQGSFYNHVSHIIELEKSLGIAFPINSDKFKQEIANIDRKNPKYHEILKKRLDEITPNKS